ncbi:MAG: hypothetical protein ACW99J_15305 [Candidatus Thorarchaeota archaeon]|jgi:hypothetical protein
MKSLEEFLDDDPQYREQIVEYRFLSELIQYLASKGRRLEILRVHTDSFGYDLVLKVDDITKYVQLKSVKMGGKAASWDAKREWGIRTRHYLLCERGNESEVQSP